MSWSHLITDWVMVSRLIKGLKVHFHQKARRMMIIVEFEQEEHNKNKRI